MSRLLSRTVAAARSFAHERRGSTAVEFAVIAIPFMTLLFGVIELALMLLVSSTVDTAVQFAARNVRTGEFQTTGSVSANDFKGLVCRNMNWLEDDCMTRLTVESQTFNNYNDLANSQFAATETFNPADARCWSVGAPKDVVLMRVYYRWDLITPLLNDSLANSTDNKRLIVSSSAFRNEPYDPNQEKVGAKCT